MSGAHPERRAEPCGIPAAAGPALDGPGVGLDDTAGNRYWLRIAAACSFLLLAGCNATPPLPEVRILKVPIPVPCFKQSDLPIAPKIASNPELKTLDDFDLVLQIAAERLDLLKFSGEQTAILKTCVQP